MVHNRPHPRRPAMLSAQAADALVGDSDPAGDSVLAHTSAWALLGVGDEEFSHEAVARLRETIRAEGVDVVAHMWSRSPDFTLPGALWRLWLLAQWYERSPDVVEERFTAGMSAQGMAARADSWGLTSVSDVIGEVDALMRAEATEDDCEHIFMQAARLMQVLAAGDSLGAEWITDPSDPLAHPVTVRSRALLRTSEELGKAAFRAARGALD